MRIDIITCLPKLLESPFSDSILKRAIQKNLVTINIHDLRDYASGKQQQTDDYAYGGGAGMVMMIEPIWKCLENLKSERSYDEVIYMSPDGEKFTQSMANQLSLSKSIVIICGHYKGVDERVREHLVTREISIGDYVLSSGELAASVVADALIRLMPGVISDETSALTDSFQDNLLAPPIYTRPAAFNHWKVPDVLLSGNKAAIETWRNAKAVERTKQRRPDILDNDLKN